MKFIKNNISTLLLVNTASGINYLFQVAVARKLSVDDFGIFNSLNALVAILSAPFSIVTLICSRSTAQLSSNNISCVKTLIITALKVMLFLGISAFLLGVMAMPILKQYLHIQFNLPIILMLIYWGLSFLLPVFNGVLQGLKRFKGFGLICGSYSLTRLLLGLLWVVVLGWGVNGAILAEVTGYIVTIILGFWLLRDLMKTIPEPLEENLWKEMRSFFYPASIFTIVSFLFGNIDILMVRHYFPNEAGLYAIGSILGKICLFIPSAFNIVLFPEAVLANESGKDGGRFLWIVLGLTLLFAGSTALIFCMWPSEIISLFFGIKYQQAAPILQYISLSMTLMALTNVIATNSMAQSKFLFLWPLGGGMLMFLILIGLLHDSSLIIAQLLFLSTGFISVGVFLSYFLLKNRKPKINVKDLSMD